MNALLIVCPHCQAKYQVASADVQGKTVSCKKCSQKFVAKVMQAKPKAAPAAAKPAAPPAANDDLFGDLIGSAAGSDPFGGSSSGASPLAALPRKKSSSKSIPWVMIAIGGGAVAMLLVLVIAVVSFMSSIDTNGLSGLSSSSNNDAARLAAEDFAAHSKIADTQTEIMTEFVVAIEAVQQESDVPAMIQKLEALTARIRSQAEEVKKLPRLSEKQNAKLTESVKQRMKPMEERAKAAGQKLASYKTPGLMKAMFDFQTAGREVGEAISSAQPRTTMQPVAKAVEVAESTEVDAWKAEREARKAEMEVRRAEMEAKIAAAQAKVAAAREQEPENPQNTMQPEANDPEPPANRLDALETKWEKQVYISGQMFNIHDEMVSAVGATSQADNIAALMQKLEAWTAQFREQAEKATYVGPLTSEESTILSGSIDRRLNGLDFIGGAIVPKLKNFKSPELMTALTDYLAAAADVRQAVIATRPMLDSSATVSVDVAKHREFQRETLDLRKAQVEIDYSITSASSPLRYKNELDKLTQRVNDLNKKAKDAYGISKLLQDCVAEEMLAEIEAFSEGIDAERLTEKLKNREFRTPQVKAVRDKQQAAFAEFYTVINNQKPRGPDDISETPSSKKRVDSRAEELSRRLSGPHDIDSMRRMGPGRKAEAPESAEVLWAKEKERKLAAAQPANTATRQEGGMQLPTGMRPPSMRPPGMGMDPRGPGMDPRGPGMDPRGPGMDPSGPGFDPRGPGSGPRGPGFSPPNRPSEMRDRVGADKMVTLRAPTINRQQIKAVTSRLENQLSNRNYSSHSSGQGAVLELEYSGDIQELAKQIDFGEIDEVNVEERWIRLKSITISE